MSAASRTWDVYESPVGPLTLIAAGDGRLTGVFFPGRTRGLAETSRRPELFADAVRQLEEYFGGERRRFELRLELQGNAFQRRVWDELARIPYGATLSYGELARRIGQPGEARDVGWAVGRTPVPILVPCHRVIGADGSLTGYGGGLQRKQALLDLEARVATGKEPEPAWALRQTQLV
jgi:methylated-DNA-[protein]-cysteine S-methyltransferase